MNTNVFAIQYLWIISLCFLCLFSFSVDYVSVRFFIGIKVPIRAENPMHQFTIYVSWLLSVIIIIIIILFNVIYTDKTYYFLLQQACVQAVSLFRLP